MKKIVTSFLASALALIAVSCQSKPRAAAAPALTTEQEAKDLKLSLFYIASDELEGRGLLTDGLNRAADYIADHFKQAGLKPVPGLDGYFQPFKLSVGARNGPNTKLAVAGQALTIDKQFVPSAVSTNGSFTAPGAAFVGYGLKKEDGSYDDFAGVDLAGKVAVAFRFVPEFKKVDESTPKFRSADASLASKAKNAAEAGAVALIVVNPPGQGPDKLSPITRSRTARNSERATIPVMQVSAATFDSWVAQAGAGQNAKSLETQIRSTAKSSSFALATLALAGTVDIDRSQREVKNVVAMLPGKGPHADEYVVVGAHYDHLGRGEPGSLAFNSTEIHNGADDNGSGTVAVVELAKKMAAQGPRDRTIIFMTFVGEERGLLGSAHFVANPPISLDKIVAMLNLDMVGRLKDNVLLVGGTGTAAGFDELMKRASEGSPFNIKTPGQDFGGKGGIGPSDHESFAMKKIPVIFFFTGVHPDYHQPSDDPEKINYTGMAQIVDLSAKTLDEMCKMPREEYVSTFDRGMFGGGGNRRGASTRTTPTTGNASKQAGDQGGAAAPTGGAEQSNGVRLGVMPDYASGDDEKSPGVRISGVMPDTPAATAGLAEGDIIVQINDKPMKTLQDLSSFLAEAKPGDKAKIAYLRKSERREAEVTLAPRGG